MSYTTQSLVNKVGAGVAFGMVVLLGFTIYALVYIAVPEANQNALLVLIGAVSTNVTAVVSFFFGSSSGNKAKDDAVNTLAATAAAAQSALAPIPGAPDKTVPLAPGETAVVHADEVKP
jgi:hypothetical protein